ncbi:S-layer family protein [Paenibacillus cellulosilyticus]|uniref:S-layer family protein n=1 Tax=Paenibacillus cellulosilyticus TaxID=375489 RepID=A0A2V2YUX5_9BACL|nr:S-layer homology domain-containing protein [Paenibacillus cellulosilyticus]PWW04910.1 S-layer family protein [Paenibacillus cellulosilyticus]QKS46012.1 carbohydrate-binding domain-containing protein [Paenibacillus cellulosilyticus]
MIKKLTSTTLALALSLSSTAYIAAAADDTGSVTSIALSDSGVTVDGQAASTSSTDAVYTGADIIYYEDGHDSSYGEGTEADAHESSEADEHTVVTITEPGTYRLSGRLSAGQVAVDLGEDAATDPTAKVTLIMDGVDITSTVAPAVIFYNVYEPYSADEDTKGVTDLSDTGAQVILADGSVNEVDGSYVARIYKEGTTKKLHKYDGAFYSRMSMNISGETLGTGELHITGEKEGLDSELHLSINGGQIYIESQDDGINTNEDGISVTTINGGYLHVNAGLGAEGDGIDSNGYLTINGGTIVTMANDRSPDGGIDADSDIAINGGTVIALGTRNDATGTNSKQTFMELSFASTQKAGSVITLKDADGNELLNHTAEKAFQSVTFSSSELATNEEYHVYIDGVEQQYTGNSFGMMGGGGVAGMGAGGDFTRPERTDNGTAPTGQTPPTGDFTGGAPSDAGSFNPQASTEDQANVEGSTAFTITSTVHSFSGISASSEASGKTRVTFSVNNGSGVKNVVSGGKLVLDSITSSVDVADEDIQLTITDVPSESFSSSILLSEGLDALTLPTDDGTYQLTVAVVSDNAEYTGTAQYQFTIGGLPFTDLSPSDSAYTAVKTLYEKGILVGTSDTTFSPNANVTRATAVTALGRLLGIEQAETTTFQDVKQGSWYSGYVGWASSNEIVLGDGSGNFLPNSNITSKQMDLILTRYAALAGIEYTSAENDSEDHALTRKELAVILAELIQ